MASNKATADHSHTCETQICLSGNSGRATFELRFSQFNAYLVWLGTVTNIRLIMPQTNPMECVVRCSKMEENVINIGSYYQVI